jgi:hypothetical protein
MAPGALHRGGVGACASVSSRISLALGGDLSAQPIRDSTDKHATPTLARRHQGWIGIVTVEVCTAPLSAI